ncbi:MAG: replication factor C large subunit [Candidatus Micrarchaeia archaeon]|jgi:replication factor C large subunit
MLCEKYAPASLNGIVGNRQAIEALKRFGEEILQGRIPKPLMLYGPSGVGKTTAAIALAATYGFGILLLAASDYRDADTLNKKLLPATQSRGLFARTNLIVFDEIDELSEKFDKGAQTAILSMVRNSKQPIMFIANDYWSQKISFLRQVAVPVEFKQLGTDEVLAYITRISQKEHANIGMDALKEIALRSNGDMRGAINDLEFAISGKSNALEALGIRNRKYEIFKVLDSIFLSRSFGKALAAFENSDVEFEMLLKWIDENIPNRYGTEDAQKAYELLAHASMYEHKASRLSYYALRKYASVLASAGVSISSSGYVTRLKSYSFPKQIKLLSETKESRLATSLAIAKLSKGMHASARKLRTEFLPFLKLMPKEVAEPLLEAMGLSKEEAASLAKS